ncbi:hypothetical protein [Prochlorococcus sp. MIT 1307]|uniref:hypothetical protein n=1 Tax=Prochlorococcus sp. MIT 1307 TaxID=3096219 RepID=UPI002A7665FB|nr:hypothetical protein [Prochlorococcus sp. MIT 1307]
MDSELTAISKPYIQGEMSSKSSQNGVIEGIDGEDPYTLSGTSIPLFGLTMAIAVVGVPLVAVLTERPSSREIFVPTAVESDGSKLPLTLSLPRLGESRS